AETGFKARTTGDDSKEVAAQDIPSFLIATSAGEVGVDMDADHMVCDLVAWERMVQRLGRVNRRGRGSADITVLVPPPPDKKGKPEDHAADMKRLRAPLEGLPDLGDEARDASPCAILSLKEKAAGDSALAMVLNAATTSVPLRPALTRPLLDAWSMTSLKDHAGRPEVGPWLRGWVEEDLQTALIWRHHLPVRDGGAADPAEVVRFFEVAGPQQAERLETEAWRALDILTKRAKDAVRRLRKDAAKGDAAPSEEASHRRVLKSENIVVLVLSGAGELHQAIDLESLASLPAYRKDRMIRAMTERTVIVDAALGGLSSDGLLDPKADGPVATLDLDTPFAIAGDDEAGAGDKGMPDMPFRVERRTQADDASSSGPYNDGWKAVFSLPVRFDEGGESIEDLIVHVPRKRPGASEGDPAVARCAQRLTEHLDWVRDCAAALADDIGLGEDLKQALVLAAHLHDRGKDRELWQTAMKVPVKDRPYAKTAWSGNGRLLGGYRHEFGSLGDAQQDGRFEGLQSEMRDLTLHLIAAHHGHARPVIAALDPDFPPDAPLLRARAREVALRFAALQKRWGPWGLVWLETLLRAADRRASVLNDRQQDDMSEMKEAG
ncbi:MAG: hypothetical protein ACFB21_04470, partial [Opitutales bacterium]